MVMASSLPFCPEEDCILSQSEEDTFVVVTSLSQLELGTKNYYYLQIHPEPFTDFLEIPTCISTPSRSLTFWK